MDRVNWQRVRDILFCAVCICALFWVGWNVSGLFIHAIVLLLLAMAVAFLVSPAVNIMVRYRVPRLPATLLVYVLILALFGGLCYLIVFSLIRQVQAFSVTVQNYAQQVPAISGNLQHFLVQEGIPQTKIDETLSQIESQATDFARTLVNNLVNVVFTLTNAVINILLVAVISFYLTLDGKRIRDSIFKIAPRRSLPHLLLFEDALNRVVGNYIRGQLSLATIVGLLAGIGCATPWLGLGDYALIIGVLAFLFETIPMVGPALATIPAVLISLLLPHPFPRTFWVIVYFTCIQLLESNVLGPRIVGHAVGLHPVASILALLIFADLFGPFGALIATPVVAALWVVIASLYRSFFKGETAEEILTTHRRKPWVLRRRKPRLQRLEKPPAAPEAPGNAEIDIRKVNAAPTIKKGIDMDEKIEQLDLLRPVPDSQEQRSPQAGEKDARK